jgi:uncharacterized Zn finger protein
MSQIDPTKKAAWLSLISDANLKIQAGEKVFERGQGYLRENAVKNLKVTLDESDQLVVTSAVVGTWKYAVKMKFESAGLDIKGGCGCPHSSEDGYFCKHQVATAMKVREQMASNAWSVKKMNVGDIEKGGFEKTRAFLMKQTKEVLVSWMMEKSKKSQALRTDLKLWGLQKNVEFDEQTIEQSIQQLIFLGSTDLQGTQCTDYAKKIKKAMGLVKAWMPKEPSHARKMCESMMRMVSAVLLDSEDAYGDLNEVVNPLQELHLAALRAAPPQKGWIEEWLVEAEADDLGLWDVERMLEAAGKEVKESYKKRFFR